MIGKSTSRIEARACAPEQRPLQNRHNVCGHPYSSQIRWNVCQLGHRAPVPSSRYSRMLTPSAHAA